jgi:hypothetical protein
MDTPTEHLPPSDSTGPTATSSADRSPAGRHRAAPTRSGPPAVAVVGLAALVAVAIGVAGFIVLRSPGPTVVQLPIVAGTPPAGAQVTVPRPTAAGTTVVVGRRSVTAAGGVVTVDETIQVVRGPALAVVASAGRATAALGHGQIQLLTSGGISTPAAMASPGSGVHVIALYPLRHCPDILPATWPTPVSLHPSTQGLQVSWQRVEEPLLDAAQLCPAARSSAHRLAALRGTVVGSTRRTATVRLRWQGPHRVAVLAAGAPGGLALVAKPTVIAAHQSRVLHLRVVDRCTARPRHLAGLPLWVRVHGGRRVVLIQVSGLARWVDHRVC